MYYFKKREKIQGDFMKAKSLGQMICSLRKEKGMTQNDLAGKMNVTDKAVSKWERDLSYPDINSIPRLAETLDVSVEELLNAKKAEEKSKGKIMEIIDTALVGVGLAMGICVTVLSILKKIETNSAILMLAFGMACFGIHLLKDSGKS